MYMAEWAFKPYIFTCV